MTTMHWNYGEINMLIVNANLRLIVNCDCLSLVQLELVILRRVMWSAAVAKLNPKSLLAKQRYTPA